MIRQVINYLLCYLPASRFFFIKRWLLRLSGVDLGDGVCICGGGWIYGRGELIIGESTWLSPRIIFYTNPDASIKLGQRCDIGPGVEFIPGGHQIGRADRRAGEGAAKPIVIGDGCWIGAKCVILGGVRIGNGSVVAAGSVVTQDVPDNTLVAGVPASIKRELSE